VGYLAAELAYEGDVWEWTNGGNARYRVIGAPTFFNGRLNVPLQALHISSKAGHCPDYSVTDWDEWHKYFTLISRDMKRYCPNCETEAQTDHRDYLCFDCRARIDA
jgi:hypothetical protein